MDEFTLEQFGKQMNAWLLEHEAQMLITLPQGQIEPVLQDNFDLGPIVQFWMLLNSIQIAADELRKQLEIQRTAPEWSNLVDALLGQIRTALVEEADNHA